MVSSARVNAASLAVKARVRAALRSIRVARAWSTSLNSELTLNALFFQIGDPRLEGVAFERELAGAPVGGADLVGAAKQMLARFAKKLFARCCSCLQRIETHALGCKILGLLERARYPNPLTTRSARRCGPSKLKSPKRSVSRRCPRTAYGKLRFARKLLFFRGLIRGRLVKRNKNGGIES